MGRKKVSCESCPAGFEHYFLHFSEEDKEFLNTRKLTTFYRKGEVVFREHSLPLGVYCLYEGKVKVFRNGHDGREQITRLILPGEFFGLKAMLNGLDHSVTATAMEDATVCFLNKCDFLQLMVSYPEFTRELINAFSRRLESTESRMISLAYKPVRERLAETLVFLFKSFYSCTDQPEKRYLNLTRMDLANIVGTAQETVIRLLSEMKEQEIIQVSGRKIFLKDPKRLEMIANSNE